MDLPGSGERRRQDFKRKFLQIAIQYEIIREEENRAIERIWEWQQESRRRREEEEARNEATNPEQQRDQQHQQQNRRRTRTTLDEEEDDYIPEEADLEEEIAWRVMHGSEWGNG